MFKQTIFVDPVLWDATLQEVRNKTITRYEAAAKLGMSYRNMLYHLRKQGIKLPDQRRAPDNDNEGGNGNGSGNTTVSIRQAVLDTACSSTPVKHAWKAQGIDQLISYEHFSRLVAAAKRERAETAKTRAATELARAGFSPTTPESAHALKTSPPTTIRAGVISGAAGPSVTAHKTLSPEAAKELGLISQLLQGLAVRSATPYNVLVNALVGARNL